MFQWQTQALGDRLFGHDDFNMVTIDIHESAGSHLALLVIPYLGIRNGNEFLRFADVIRYPGFGKDRNMPNNPIMAR
jgi:hypothetical protein